MNIPYLGFYPRHAKFKGVHDNLYVRSIVISDGIKKIVVISTDAIGFSNSLFSADTNFTQEIRNKIHEIIGIADEDIMFTANHIHSTPDTLNFRSLIDVPGSKEWLQNMVENIVLSVKKANNNRFKSYLRIGKGNVEGISINRRMDKCLDTEIIIMLFKSVDSDDSVLIVNYACHPVIVQVQDMVSGDYVGFLESTVEDTVKGIKACLFLQGACGDINPRVNDSRDFDDVNSVGTTLANEVIRILQRLDLLDDQIQPAVIRTISKLIKLPARPLPDDEFKEKIFKKLTELSKEPCITDDEKINFAKTEEICCRLKEDSEFYDAEIQVLRIGDCLLTGISGEMFCEMGFLIKEKAAPLIGIPIGYANGYVGYIAPSDAWEKGGYEVQLGMWSKVGLDSFEIINDTICNIFKEIL